MKLFGPTSDNALGSGDLGSLSDPVGLVRGSAAEQTEMRQTTCEALWNLSASNLAPFGSHHEWCQSHFLSSKSSRIEVFQSCRNLDGFI